MPQAVAQAPSLQTRAPDVVNNVGRLWVSLPVLNTGAGTATALTVTAITLGTAARIEPALPFVLGDLAPNNTIGVAAGFRSDGLVVGSRLTLVVQGTYRMEGSTFGFTLNRPVTVPPASAPVVPALAARVEVAVAAGVWSYTLFNEESGTPRHINAISLDLASPVVVTGTPPGWAVETDTGTYVAWIATDTQLPYPSQIAPGASLGGFRVRAQAGPRASEAKPYTITSWNHQTDQADLVVFGTTLVPARD